MSVFTVYNCGTGANRDTDGEIVAFLAKNTAGPQAGGVAANRHGTWMITDGVGKSRDKSKGTGAYMPGVHDPRTGQAIAPKGLRHAAKMVGLARGMIGGFGWEQNTDYVIETIGSLATLPTKINMAGWSRGAITCHKIAHRLAERWPDIPVNIFAFDPVPGPGNFETANITLPPNVDHYSVMQMEDEARWIMRPMSFQEFSSTDDSVLRKKFHYYGMPGQHDTGVMWKNTEVGQIGCSLAIKFLRRHGTDVDGVKLDRRTYLENYAAIRMKMASYRKLKGGMARAGYALKRGAVNRQFSESKFFINGHHRSAFAKEYPQLVTYLDSGVSRPGMDPTVQLKALATMLPKSYLALDGLGWIPN